MADSKIADAIGRIVDEQGSDDGWDDVATDICKKESEFIELIDSTDDPMLKIQQDRKSVV